MIQSWAAIEVPLVVGVSIPMKDDSGRRLRAAFGWVAAAVVVTVATLLVASALWVLWQTASPLAAVVGTIALVPGVVLWVYGAWVSLDAWLLARREPRQCTNVAGDAARTDRCTGRVVEPPD
jgi:protein-S-isoprenylcysteine O-methyltransferase Ste14